jgi:type IV pilus assembly protein PilC
MSTLLGAGVNVLDVIDICRGVTGNVYYNDLWTDMENGVREGKQISDSLTASDVVPGNVASMIAAGERSGQLPDVMEKIADFSETELDDSVKAVTALIEPLMIVIMGAIVGAIAIALIWPIMEMRATGLGAIRS